MRSAFVLFFLILAVGASAQTQPAKPASPTPKPPTAPATSAPQTQAMPPQAQPAAAPNAENVAPTAPVITVNGACTQAGAAPNSPGCKVEVTRADFERLTKALEPNMQTAARAGFADTYTKVLVVSREATQRGIENDPEAQEVLRFQRMQTLAQLLIRKIQKDASNVPPADAEAYYKEHSSQWEEATLRRLYFPKNPPGDAKKLSDADLSALADRLQKRAAAGEDLEKLEADAYTEMGIKTPPPPSNLGPVRRIAVPQAQQQAVFGLQPGQVSPVIADSYALYVYKLESKRLLPLDQVRSEITRAITEERFRKAIGQLFTNVSAQLNPEYFGPGAKVELPNAEGQVSPPQVAPGSAPARPAGPPKQ
jgi:PPIC-type PPIASE domain